MQFLKFSLVGISNTLISEGLYILIVFLDGHYLLASLIGFVVSVLNAYYWNNRYVFKETEDGEKRVWWKTLLKTYTAYSGGFVLNALLLILWIDILNIGGLFSGLADFCFSLGIRQLDAQTLGEIFAAGINLIVTVPLNFLINKYWTFKQKRRKGCYDGTHG